MFFFRSRFNVVQKIFFDGEKKERAGKTNGRKTKKKSAGKKSAAFEFQTDWCHWRLIRVFLKKKSSRRTRFTKRTFGLWTEFFRERCFRSVYNCWVFVQNNDTASLSWASLKEISTDNLFWREINRNQSIQHFLFRANFFRVWTESCFSTEMRFVNVSFAQQNFIQCWIDNSASNPMISSLLVEPLAQF